jgi:hypothetical protein
MVLLAWITWLLLVVVQVEMVHTAAAVEVVVSVQALLLP